MLYAHWPCNTNDHNFIIHRGRFLNSIGSYIIDCSIRNTMFQDSRVWQIKRKTCNKRYRLYLLKISACVRSHAHTHMRARQGTLNAWIEASTLLLYRNEEFEWTTTQITIEIDSNKKKKKTCIEYTRRYQQNSNSMKNLIEFNRIVPSVSFVAIGVLVRCISAGVSWFCRFIRMAPSTKWHWTCQLIWIVILFFFTNQSIR